MHLHKETENIMATQSTSSGIKRVGRGDRSVVITPLSHSIIAGYHITTVGMQKRGGGDRTVVRTAILCAGARGWEGLEKDGH